MIQAFKLRLIDFYSINIKKIKFPLKLNVVFQIKQQSKDNSMLKKFGSLWTLIHETRSIYIFPFQEGHLPIYDLQTQI